MRNGLLDEEEGTLVQRLLFKNSKVIQGFAYDLCLLQTMLSLSKLSVLASDEPDNVIGKKLDELESHLDIVRAQQKLPQSVVEQYGFDEETMRVLTPREIIEVIHFINWLKE